MTPGDRAAALEAVKQLAAGPGQLEDPPLLRLLDAGLARAAELGVKGLPEAKGVYERCARLDAASCQVRMAELDPEHATDWLASAIRLGDPEAKLRLGLQLRYGNPPADPERGLALIREAYTEGEADAGISLALALIDDPGPDTQARLAEARAILQHVEPWAMAAAPYHFWRASVFSDEAAVRAQAYEALKRAVKAQNPRALLDLALEREDDGPLGPADSAESNRIYEAVWAGDLDPWDAKPAVKAPSPAYLEYVARAVVDRADNLRWGVGGPQDLVRAEALYRAALARGSMDAAFGLGELLAEVEGRPAAAVEARELLKLAADAGHSPAMVSYGDALWNAVGGPPDRAGAFSWWQKAAAAGHGRGMWRVGHMLAVGVESPGGQQPGGVGAPFTLEADPKAALQWLERSAALGVGQAMLELGQRRLSGDGVPADVPDGLRRLEAAVAANVRGAREALARRVADGGPSTPVERPRALVLAQEAADRGSAEGWFLVARLLHLDPKAGAAKALPAYRHAADGGYAEAGLYAGRLLLDPDVGTPDAKAAAQYLAIAAEAGYLPAISRLAWLLIEGADGVPADPARGKAWLVKAAEGDYTDACTDLASLLSGDDADEASKAEAVRWARRAHELGDAVGTAQLGAFLLEGLGAPADPAAGVELLRKALEGGNGWAGKRLGQWLLEQKPPRIDEAVGLLQKGAEAGEVACLAEIADLYRDGGLTPDPAKHRVALEKAADAGHLGAAAVLAERYPDSRHGMDTLMQGALDGNALASRAVILRCGKGRGGADCEPLLAAIRERAEKGDARMMLVVSGLDMTYVEDPKRLAQGCAWAGKALAARAPAAACTAGLCLVHGFGGDKDPGRGGDQLRACVKFRPDLGLRPLFEALKAQLVRPLDEGEPGRVLKQLVEVEPSHRVELADALYDGALGLSRDVPAAARLYRELAEEGDASAATLLGIILYYGVETAVDRPEAARWLRKGSDGGDVRASGLLAMMLISGDSVTQDAREAVKLAEEPARQGIPNAMLVMGIAALDGMERSRDLIEAERWLLPAAENGNVRAMMALAVLYGRGGDGVEATRSRRWPGLASRLVTWATPSPPRAGGVRTTGSPPSNEAPSTA